MFLLKRFLGSYCILRPSESFWKELYAPTAFSDLLNPHSWPNRFISCVPLKSSDLLIIALSLLNPQWGCLNQQLQLLCPFEKLLIIALSLLKPQWSCFYHSITNCITFTLHLHTIYTQSLRQTPQDLGHPLSWAKFAYSQPFNARTPTNQNSIQSPVKSICHFWIWVAKYHYLKMPHCRMLSEFLRWKTYMNRFLQPQLLLH